MRQYDPFRYDFRIFHKYLLLTILDAAFILAFERAPEKFKKTSGMLNGICIQVGVTVGTFLAIPV